MRVSLSTLLLVALSHLGSARENIIVDTDLFSDVDDAGALMLAATHANLNLLAVNVNYPSTYSVLCASALLAHYGRADCPVGIKRPLNNNTFFDSRDFELGEYASKIAFHWSGGTLPWGHAEDAWDPVELYRKTLANAEDGSVTIASIGFLDNVCNHHYIPGNSTAVTKQLMVAHLEQLSALLNSTADSYSSLDGRALIKRKVSELVVMGGGYPNGRSWNFWGSASALSAHVINTWEGPITFVGDDVGEHVLTGAPLMGSPYLADPVRMAYIYYGYFSPRPSWDPLAILYVAEGLERLFEPGNENGYNYVNPVDGSNHWVFEKTERHQRFLRMKASNESTAEALDSLFIEAAKQFASKTRGLYELPLGATKSKGSLIEFHPEL